MQPPATIGIEYWIRLLDWHILHILKAAFNNNPGIIHPFTLEDTIIELQLLVQLFLTIVKVAWASNKIRM